MDMELRDSKGERVTPQQEELGNHLFKAVLGNNLDDAKKALDEGADPNIVDLYKDKTPVFYAQTPEMVKLLHESGADLNAKSDEQTVLIKQIHHADDSPGVIKTLLDLGADPNIQDYSDKTALHRVLEARPGTFSNGEQLSLATTLLESNADPNIQDDKGRTCLRTYLDNRHSPDMDIIRQMLEHGADPTIPNNEGDTVFDRHNADGVEQLLAEKTIGNPAFVKKLEDAGRTELVEHLKGLAAPTIPEDKVKPAPQEPSQEPAKQQQTAPSVSSGPSM